MKHFTGCGGIICYPVQVVFVLNEISYGKSFLQKEASREIIYPLDNYGENHTEKLSPHAHVLEALGLVK